MTITKPTIKEFLSSTIVDYEMDEGYITLVSEDYEDYYAILNADHFNKEVYDLPRWTSDPTEVVSVGTYNIDALNGIDRYFKDEWDLSDICEVFHSQSKEAKVDFA